MTSRSMLPRPVLCYYADNPARRPHCTLTAEITLGPVALCGSCAAARSTLGKGIAAVPLPPGPAVDVLDWVADASLAVGQACHDLDAAVTRQAAAQRYGHQPSQRNEG